MCVELSLAEDYRGGGKHIRLHTARSSAKETTLESKLQKIPNTLITEMKINVAAEGFYSVFGN